MGLLAAALAPGTVEAQSSVDGDDDAFLGRTLGPSQYLENLRGRFVNRSESMPGDVLPYFVSAVSAVDYDQDGLLDLSRRTCVVGPLGPADRLGDPKASLVIRSNG